MNERVPAGVAGVDEILKGGLIADRSYIVLGAPGVGKTIFSLQFLLEGVRRKERTLCLTLIEPAAVMRSNVESFGWDLDEVAIVDLTKVGLQEPGDYKVFSASEVESTPYYEAMYSAIEEYRPQRLVIDSLTQLGYLAAEEYHFRKELLRLMLKLRAMNCTTLMTHEPSRMASSIYSGLAVDGILRLTRDLSDHKSFEVRAFEVEKFRGSGYRPGRHHFRFSDDGIQVYPNQELRRTYEDVSREQLKSGVGALDDLIGGGIEIGTTTLVSGPTGVGKSTLAAQFLTRAAASNTNLGSCLYLSFEEAPSSIIRRNEGIGIHLEEVVSSGRALLEYVHPRQYYPEELLLRVQKIIEEGCRFVVIDGIRGYEFAMAPFGDPLTELNNLLAMLAQNGVTIILTNEVEVIAGGELKATETGASYLCDNLILMRYAEYAAEVIKLIGCLKKRLSPFQPELRRLTISPAPVGLEVGPRLQNLRGILTGVPQVTEA